jgi:hypothetical protein
LQRLDGVPWFCAGHRGEGVRVVGRGLRVSLRSCVQESIHAVWETKTHGGSHTAGA